MGQHDSRWARLLRAFGLGKAIAMGPPGLPKEEEGPRPALRQAQTDAEGFGLWIVEGEGFKAPLWIGRSGSRAWARWAAPRAPAHALRHQGAKTWKLSDPHVIFLVHGQPEAGAQAGMAARLGVAALSGESAPPWRLLDPCGGDWAAEGARLQALCESCASPWWRAHVGEKRAEISWEARPLAFDDNIERGWSPMPREHGGSPQSGQAPNVDESRYWGVRTGEAEVVVHMRWARELVFSHEMGEWGWCSRVSVEIDGRPLFSPSTRPEETLAFAPKAYRSLRGELPWAPLEQAPAWALAEALMALGDPKNLAKRGQDWRPLNLETFERDVPALKQALSSAREIAVAAGPEDSGVPAPRAAWIQRQALARESGDAAAPKRSARL